MARLSALLADVFALYVKTKNFHWHVSGPHFRDYHLLVDEQAAQILAMMDDIAERARKIGGTTIRSIAHIARVTHVEDNDADFVTPEDKLAELKEDNLALTQRMRQTRNVCDEHGDVATVSLVVSGIDEAHVAHGSCSRQRGKLNPERTPPANFGWLHTLPQYVPS